MNSALPTSGLVMQHKELRQIKSVSFHALDNPAGVDSKREANDQGKYSIIFSEQLCQIYCNSKNHNDNVFFQNLKMNEQYFRKK